MSNRPIAPIDTPDPWILKHNSLFYLTFTLGNRVEIWSSTSPEDFFSPNTCKSLIWKPPQSEHWNTDLWAPELHNLNGTWYVYFCAAPRAQGNPGHRTVVLRSHDSDPMNAQSWTFLGPLQGLPDDQWSIDATVFTLPDHTGRQQLYCCYSGWPLGDHSDTQQDLFLVRLANPEQAIRESLTCISCATLPWERPEGGRRGVNEGPTFLSIPPCHSMHSGFQGIIFSAHGSWGPEYKLGVLALVNPNDPCREDAWVKRPVPLLLSDTGKGPPFGPGHASFLVESGQQGGSGTVVYCVYHGTEKPDEGWSNRKARMLRMDPGAFGPQAMPVCCAGGLLGGGGFDWNMQGVRPPAEMGPGLTHGGNPGYPGATGNGGSAGAKPVGNMTGTGGKIWSEVEKKVPAQYKGYLDKVKKFF